MKNKKIVAFTTATVISANMIPAGLLHTFAEEPTVEQDQAQVQDVETLQENLEVEAKAAAGETAERNLTVNVEGYDSKFGIIEGLDSNTINVNSKFEYTKSDKWPYIQYWNNIGADPDKEFKVTAKSGYEVKLSTDVKLITNIFTTPNNINSDLSGYANQYNVTVKPFSTLINENNKDVKSYINIEYRRKSNAQDIKLQTVNIGEGGLILPENLYFDENNNAAIDNGSDHTFKINPSENQEAYVTLNGAPVAIENNQFTVGAGELKVEFKEKVQKYDLDVEIEGLGSIVIGGENVSESKIVQLNQNEDIILTVEPGKGYYLDSVRLNGEELNKNENGLYTAPYSEIENQKLEVTFAEKIETKVVFESLRVPWNGEKQPLSYKIVGPNNEVLEENTVIFKYPIINKEYTPKDIGEYKFKVEFEENDKYKSCIYEGTYEIYDNRQSVTIEFGELTKVYNGEVQEIEANVVNEAGEVVGKAEINYKRKIDINDPFAMLLTLGKDVGVHDFTATFKGNYEYSKVEVEGQLEITKCKPTVKVANKTTSYTESPTRTNVTVTPDCGYINLYSGVDLKLSPTVYMDVNLGSDGLGKLISDAINKSNVGNIGDLKKLLASEELIKLLEVAGINIGDITKALSYLPDNMALSFGAPINAGAYVSTAIVLDRNAEVTVGVGSLLISKANKEVIFTEDSLTSGAKIKAGEIYKHEAVIKGTNENVEVKYTGVTSDGKVYSSTEAPQVAGKYVATASFKGNQNYRPAIAVREFSITKSSSKIIIVSSSLKKYDGNPYELKAVVKDENGNYIDNAKLDITYIKGLKKLSSAPKDIGTYFVTVKYVGDESHTGSTTYMNLKISK